MTIEEQKALVKFLVEQKKILTSEQLKEALLAQRVMQKMGIEKTIDQVIIEKGFIDTEMMTHLIHEFRGGDEELIRGYRILAKIGEGAVGEVFRAVDLQNNGRLVAIKILFSHLSQREATVQRFMREAKLCVDLNHPHIVKGYEFGLSGERYFYAMEFVAGNNLTVLFEREGPFSEQRGIHIMLQIASALEHAARFQLIHRDVKPDNIILSADGNSKLCDLGLARDWTHDLALTRTGAVMGTPYYISPEAARGVKELDARSDIYSLGATFYHLVVGRVPFPGQSVAVVLAGHVKGKFVPTREARPDLSAEFSAILNKMLAKDPGERHQSATELILDLQRLKTQKLGTPEKIPQNIRRPEEPQNLEKPKPTGGHAAEKKLLPTAERTTREETDTAERLAQEQAPLPIVSGLNDEVEEYPIYPPEPHREEMLKIPRHLRPSSTDTVLSTLFTTSEQRALHRVQWKLFLVGALFGIAILTILILLIMAGWRFFSHH